MARNRGTVPLRCSRRRGCLVAPNSLARHVHEGRDVHDGRMSFETECASWRPPQAFRISATRALEQSLNHNTIPHWTCCDGYRGRKFLFRRPGSAPSHETLILNVALHDPHEVLLRPYDISTSYVWISISVESRFPSSINHCKNGALSLADLSSELMRPWKP